MNEIKDLYPTPPAWAKVVVWVYLAVLLVTLPTLIAWKSPFLNWMLPLVLMGNALIVLASPRPGITKKQVAATVGFVGLAALYVAALHLPAFAQFRWTFPATTLIGFVVFLWYFRRSRR
jgi:hypothetical protein